MSSILFFNWLMMRWFLLLITFNLFITSVAFTQGAYLTVLDQKTKEPVPFAHVLFESLDGRETEHEITDLDGRVVNRAAFRNTKLSISFVGYEMHESTIRPNESLTIYLEPQIFNVGETVVTGQYKPEKVDKSIYNVQVIGAKQIEEKGATNLAELLAGESNIQIQQDGVLGSSLKMQGMTGENVKILIDGVPVIGRMNGNIDLGQLDLSNVDHIEIVEGPMSVIYGTNALAGTINIITKENKRNSLLTQFNGYYETVGQYNFDASSSFRKGNHTGSLSLGRNFFDGHSFNDEIRTPLYKPKEQYKAKADYIYNNNNFKLKVNSAYFNETIQHLGLVDTIVAANSIIANDQYFYTTRFTNSLAADYKFAESFYFNFLGAYSTYIRAKNTYLKDFADLSESLSTDLTRHDTTTFNSLMLRGTVSRDAQDSKLLFQTGFDVNIDDGSGKRITDSINTAIEDYAYFLSLKYKLSENNIIQPGLRLIYNNKFNAPLIPTLNIKFGVLPGMSLRASYAKGFRAPSLKELYLDFVDANHNIHGNADLKAETNDSYNAAVEYQFSKDKHTLETETSFFLNDGKDVISLIVIDPANLYYRNENIDVRKTIGGRINLNYNFYPTLTIKAGFSLTGLSETLTLPEVDSTYIPVEDEYIHLDSSFLSDYQHTKDFSLNVSYRIVRFDILCNAFYKYNGQTTALYTDIDDETGEEFINRYNVDPYHTLDISFTKKFLQNRLTVVAGMKNLLDNTIVLTSTGYNPGQVHGGGSSGGSPVSWGRTAFISINYKITKF